MTKAGNERASFGASRIVVAVLAMTISGASWASAAQLISSCGPVWADVQLTADLTTTSSVCLDVKADGVTIDGAGHRVTSPNLAVSISDHKNVVVKRVVSATG